MGQFAAEWVGQFTAKWVGQFTAESVGQFARILHSISSKPGYDFRIIEIQNGFGVFNKLMPPVMDVKKTELIKINKN